VVGRAIACGFAPPTGYLDHDALAGREHERGERCGEALPRGRRPVYFPPMRTLQERLADVPQVGSVVWLAVRPEHDGAMAPAESAILIAARGIDGDVAARGRSGGRRQVTLVQAEHLPVIGALTGRDVTPSMLRRNVVVRGINLLSLVGLSFAIGDEVVLVGTGTCAPCAKMDEIVGAGAFQAMRGHGGITARVERGGTVRIGDAVRAVAVDPERRRDQVRAASARERS
jgi:MOSC domain-containing protein YiiM